MKIAVLSGKGGTGKTTISGNLVYSIPNSSIIDTDVEEPNQHIFLKPSIEKEISIYTEYPIVNQEKCILCGKCEELCKYSAIIVGRKQVVIFDKSCHDCGGCKIVCDSGAITYEKREIGKIYQGKSHNKVIRYGKLNVGELSGVKIINKLKEISEDEEILFIDCPPGTSCSTVSAVEDSDFAIIVVEPTPFGVSDMKMVVSMLKDMGKKFAVVINKAGLGDDEIYDYCKNENISIIGEIPFDEEVAKLYAKGEMAAEKLPKYKVEFEKIFDKARRMI
ncbi:MAG: ATP-binding protein [Fusobacterium sp. JB021]|nr:ATP-binding protein [Fusobacterium sp. JB021]MDP0507345.1 ATP-binding protein [Fusobacterium sp. JB019]